MPFIWDDYQWKLVGDGDYFDKSRFVIARKIFIQLESKKSSKFNENYLRKKFRVYGDIERIEILKTEKPEAYITYLDDSSAHAAVSAHEKSNYKIKRKCTIVPADTWIQPAALGTFGSNEDDPPLIFMLNDDCFDKIFENLEIRSLTNVAETCQKFSDLSKKFFARCDTYAVHDIGDEKRPLPMVEFRSHLKYLGPHLKAIYVRWDISYNRKQLDRMIYKMGQYLNPDKLRHMNFMDVLLSEKHFKILKPLRPNLNQFRLKIHNISIGYSPPNDLRNLPVYREINHHSFWMKIQKIVMGRTFIRNFPCDYFEFCLKEVAPFDGLTFSANFPQQQISKIVKIEPEVKRLAIVSKHAECMTRPMLYPLTKLDCLDTLHLHRVEKENILEVLNLLSEIPTLKNIKIALSGPFGEIQRNRFDLLIGQGFIELGKKLKHLEIVNIQYLSIHKMSISSFVAYAKKLKTLHFHGGQSDFDDSFIKDLGFVRQSVNPMKLNLYFDEFIVKHRLSSVDGDEFSDYVSVSHKCQCADSNGF